MYTLSDAIIDEDISTVRRLLAYGEINELDIYGFTPLIEAAIMDNVPIAKLLLENGANPNQPDVTGGTALHWAVENNNQELCTLLLQYQANPNAHNLAGQPVITIAMLRQQNTFKNWLVKQGADIIFANDYINTKLLGHMFELVGTANIVDPEHKFVEVDFEGFFLEITLGLIANSVSQFQNHFAARQMRRYAGLSQFIVDTLFRSLRLIRYQQYRVDIARHRQEINELIAQEPIIIPVGYEGHAITFIKMGDVWVKCDRREDSRLYDNIMFYRVTRPEALTAAFIKDLIYKKQSDAFINQELDLILGLEPITELKIEAQVSGNCSWANVEATIPALFFLVLMQMNPDPEAMSYYKTLALNFFNRWRTWNRDRALHFCVRSYEAADPIRKACKAELLAAILFQHCDYRTQADKNHIELILSVLMKSPYEYLLRNYLKVYYYDSPTEEGKRFADLLRHYDYLN